MKMSGREDAITKNDYVSLYSLVFLSSLMGLWGFSLVVRLSRNPQKLINLIHDNADNLYDLTPNGVQFVVDYLFWVAILSFVNLSILALTTIVLTKIAENRQKNEFNPMLPDINAHFNRFISIMRWTIAGFLFIFIIIVIYNVGFQYAQLVTQNKNMENNFICDAGYGPQIIWAEWFASESQKPYSKARLIVRYANIEHNDVKNAINCINVQTLNQELYCLDTSTYVEFDPLDILIIPNIPNSNTKFEDAFMSLSLLEILDGCPNSSKCEDIANFDNVLEIHQTYGFNLNGDPYGDNAYIFFSNNKKNTIDRYLWPEHIVTDIYRILQENDVNDRSLPSFDQLEAYITKIDQRSPTLGQNEPKRLILFINWQEDYKFDAQYLLNIKKRTNSSVWLIDFVSQQYDEETLNDLSNDLEKYNIDHIVIQLPSEGLISNLRYNLTNVRNGLKNQNIANMIRKLRSTHIIDLAQILDNDPSDKIWAASDNGKISLSLPENPNGIKYCTNILSLDSVNNENPRTVDDNIKPELIQINLTELALKFGLPLLNLIFPTSVLLITIGIIAIWTRIGT